ncbi:zinc finger BED domain-containing protein 4-like [Spodoptera litura]|uniref:Zinc finger BED domain-containing protein 4-like n=1 Tax=Spodoptera litura TaxID=69820 RepID=A0A9J7DUD6_SPOLT|nr:zinc finger BED domain-containing protein 4-like [Spodoptera litura]
MVLLAQMTSESPKNLQEETNTVEAIPDDNLTSHHTIIAQPSTSKNCFSSHSDHQNDSGVSPQILDLITPEDIGIDTGKKETSHTGVNLASEMLRVTDEWKVTQKILLAVTDNGANIKKAVEKDLGWKHFGCYAHTLNLAVQESIQRSEEVNAVINKVKTCVGYFKRSAQAWEKLEKFQVQAGKTVKRPLQNVSTRWNSTYYMLQRFLEIREEVNSSLSNLNATAMSLTVVDWELCEGVCKLLKPCEEVTKEVCGQKYVTGSIIIPITTGLISSVELIETYNHPIAVQMLQQDLIGALKNRFSNLDRSRTFTLCMFLDPRFKLYFEDQHVAESTKQHVIQLVASLINKADQDQTRPEKTDQVTDPSETATQSTLWRHYTEKMKNIQPKGTAQSRAIVEVQRYLEEKLVMPVNMALTAADRAKRYREKLKQNPEKFEEQRKKQLERLKKSRKKISELTEDKKFERKQWREEKRKQKVKRNKKENENQRATPSLSKSLS